MTVTNPAIALFAWFAAGLLTGSFAALPLLLEKKEVPGRDRLGDVTVHAAARGSRGS